MQAIEVRGEQRGQQTRRKAHLRRADNPAERHWRIAKSGAISLGMGLVQREDQRFAALGADHIGLRGDGLEHAAVRAAGPSGQQADTAGGRGAGHCGLDSGARMPCRGGKLPALSTAIPCRDSRLA